MVEQEQPDKDPEVRYSVTVPADLHQWIQRFRQEHDLSQAQVVRLALRRLRAAPPA